MRLGWLEIVLIILVMIAVMFITRIVRFNRVPGGQNERPDRQIKTAINSRTFTFFNRTGIVLIFAGGITLIATASFFRLILQSYFWALLAIAIGIIFLWFSRKNKE